MKSNEQKKRTKKLLDECCAEHGPHPASKPAGSLAADRAKWNIVGKGGTRNEVSMTTLKKELGIIANGATQNYAWMIDDFIKGDMKKINETLYADPPHHLKDTTIKGMLFVMKKLAEVYSADLPNHRVGTTKKNSKLHAYMKSTESAAPSPESPDAAKVNDELRGFMDMAAENEAEDEAAKKQAFEALMAKAEAAKSEPPKKITKKIYDQEIRDKTIERLERDYSYDNPVSARDDPIATIYEYLRSEGPVVGLLNALMHAIEERIQWMKKARADAVSKQVPEDVLDKILNHPMKRLEKELSELKDIGDRNRHYIDTTDPSVEMNADMQLGLHKLYVDYWKDRLKHSKGPVVPVISPEDLESKPYFRELWRNFKVYPFSFNHQKNYEEILRKQCNDYNTTWNDAKKHNESLPPKPDAPKPEAPKPDAPKPNNRQVNPKSPEMYAAREAISELETKLYHISWDIDNKGDNYDSKRISEIDATVAIMLKKVEDKVSDVHYMTNKYRNRLLKKAREKAKEITERLSEINARINSPKPEPPKVEPPKPEAPKPEPPKPETPRKFTRPESPKPDATKTPAPKPKSLKPDAPKPEPPKVEVPKVDAPKPDAPKPDAPKVEPPKVEAPKTPAPSDLSPARDAAKVEVPKLPPRSPSAPKVKPHEDSINFKTFAITSMTSAMIAKETVKSKLNKEYKWLYEYTKNKDPRISEYAKTLRNRIQQRLIEIDAEKKLDSKCNSLYTNLRTTALRIKNEGIKDKETRKEMFVDSIHQIFSDADIKNLGVTQYKKVKSTIESITKDFFGFTCNIAPGSNLVPSAFNYNANDRIIRMNEGKNISGPAANAATFFSIDIHEIYKIVERFLEKLVGKRVPLTDEARTNILELIEREIRQHMSTNHGVEKELGKRINELASEVEAYIDSKKNRTRIRDSDMSNDDKLKMLRGFKLSNAAKAELEHILLKLVSA